MGYIFDAIRRAEHTAPPDSADHAAAPEDYAPQDAWNAPAAAAASADHAPFDAPAGTSQAADDTLPETLALKAPQFGGEPSPRLDDRLVSLVAPASVMAEEYRSIRTTLLARCHHKRHLVHTITSATPREGKTITSLNLGLSFAELRNRSTVVVEADLRLPTFAGLLDLGDRPGLVHYLRGDATLSEVIHGVEGSRLCVLPAGERCGADAIQLLSSQRMADLLTSLRAKFDHVVIDTPPVTELADAGILGALSDEVMLVVRMEHTPRPLVEQAVRTLQGYHAPVAGVIATDQRRSVGRYHYRYGYHDHSTYRRAA